jgi:hypothetical protein
MHFADPLSVTCQACKHTGSYAVRELIALRSQCQHCSASLETAGQDMRAQIAEVNAFTAKVCIAFELEEMFDVTVADPELENIEAIQRPSDFGQYLQASQRCQDVEGGILMALAKISSTPVDERDLCRTFAELFPFSRDD